MSRVIEQLENGYWMYVVQLDDAPEYFETGILSTEIEADIWAQEAERGLLDRRARWTEFISTA